jgi:hypothetical protein
MPSHASANASEIEAAPKWLRPVDPFVASRLLIRIDPRLGVDDDAAYRLQLDAEPITGVVTVFMTSNYDTVLAAEIIDDGEHELHMLVRAATGDEAAYLLSTDEEDAENADSEGDATEGKVEDGAPAQNQNDRPESAYCHITWRETPDAKEVTETAVILWSGEVLLNSGCGVSGPFYTHQTAAKAWAFSTALSKPRDDVFSGLVIRYLCAKSKAAGLLAGGDAEFRRLNRFWMSPVRAPSVLPFALPSVPKRG